MKALSLIILLSPFLICGVIMGEETPLRVFFVGNSYTYVNDLPGLISGLAEAAGGRRIETGQETPGGCTFEKHCHDGKAIDGINHRNWDVVILQENSMMPLENPASTKKFARVLADAAKKQGARTIFYMTWARQKRPQTQADLTRVYEDLAKESHADLAPVGMAWQRAFAADPHLILHANDGSHPTPTGSYLTACVFYAKLLGKSPIGLPAEVKKGKKILVSLKPELAGKLQAVAWETVQGMKAN